MSNFEAILTKALAEEQDRNRKRFPPDALRSMPESRPRPLYDEAAGIFRECKWCQGRGCLQCPSEADKAYKREFPNGPQPIATLHLTEETTPRQVAEFMAEHINNAFPGAVKLKDDPASE